MILDLAILSLASGRVAYSFVNDDIFVRLREWVWLRSAPVFAHVEHHGELVPAALLDRWKTNEREQEMLGVGKWMIDKFDTPREPGFFGQVFECVYCMTFWASLVAVAAWWIAPDVAVAVGTPLAVWAAANAYAVKGI